MRSRNIICSGANYFKHVVDIVVGAGAPETEGMTSEQRREFGIKKMTDRRLHGTPFFFIKANSTMIGPHDTVTLPPDVSTMDWELELGVVIGKRARFVKREAALQYVAGYMVVNDLTVRERVNRKDVQEMGMDWVGSKCAADRAADRALSGAGAVRRRPAAAAHHSQAQRPRDAG